MAAAGKNYKEVPMIAELSGEEFVPLVQETTSGGNTVGEWRRVKPSEFGQFLPESDMVTFLPEADIRYDYHRVFDRVFIDIVCWVNNPSEFTNILIKGLPPYEVDGEWNLDINFDTYLCVARQEYVNPSYRPCLVIHPIKTFPEGIVDGRLFIHGSYKIKNL